MKVNLHEIRNLKSLIFRVRIFFSPLVGVTPSPLGLRAT